MSAVINEVISTTNTLSKSVSGGELTRTTSKAQNTQVTLQIIPLDDMAAFDVDVEAMVNTSSDPEWRAIGKYTRSDETLVSIIPISLGVRYRFRHVSGADCRVLLTG